MRILKYEVMRFPDGEVQAKVTEPIDRKQEYTLSIRITSAEDLFIADQLMDILDRQEVVYTVSIPYLMGTRMDRVMDFNRPFTLKLVASIFNKHNYKSVLILEPHSSRTTDLINRSEGLHDGHIWDIKGDYQFVFPDEGAEKRYSNYDSNVILCSKRRDIETGKITSLVIDNPQCIKKNRLLMVDDLCDGGGTFCGLYDEFMKINPELTIDLYVTHMVNSAGMERVYNKFNHVYTTNSYYDWGSCSRSTIYNVLA